MLEMPKLRVKTAMTRNDVKRVESLKKQIIKAIDQAALRDKEKKTLRDLVSVLGNTDKNLSALDYVKKLQADPAADISRGKLQYMLHTIGLVGQTLMLLEIVEKLFSDSSLASENALAWFNYPQGPVKKTVYELKNALSCGHNAQRIGYAFSACLSALHAELSDFTGASKLPAFLPEIGSSSNWDRFSIFNPSFRTSYPLDPVLFMQGGSAMAEEIAGEIKAHIKQLHALQEAVRFFEPHIRVVERLSDAKFDLVRARVRGGRIKLAQLLSEPQSASVQHAIQQEIDTLLLFEESIQEANASALGSFYASKRQERRVQALSAVSPTDADLLSQTLQALHTNQWEMSFPALVVGGVSLLSFFSPTTLAIAAGAVYAKIAYQTPKALDVPESFTRVVKQDAVEEICVTEGDALPDASPSMRNSRSASFSGYPGTLFSAHTDTNVNTAAVVRSVSI